MLSEEPRVRGLHPCRAFPVSSIRPSLLIVMRVRSSSPDDAIRHWSAEVGHPIEDLTTEDGLTPLPSWTPGEKTIAGYPPDLAEDAMQLVLRQAELSTENSE